MMSMRRRRSAACAAMVAALLVCAACEREQPAPAEEPVPVPTANRATVQFDSGTVVLRSGADSAVVRVEIAEREDQRAFGLMDRDRLDVDAGMIFLYRDLQDPAAGFWMYRTRIPLDIAFFDAEGRIIAIRQMAPCTSPDPARCTEEAAEYRPGAPYIGALEMNSGWFRTNGFEVGDRVVMPGRVGG